MKAIVTFRLPRNKKHDPSHKVTGLCPLYTKYGLPIGSLPNKICTDVTGEHHSYLEEGKDLDDIRQKALSYYPHITRIEVIST